MRPAAFGRRMGFALLTAAMGLASAIVWGTGGIAADRRPSVVVILTDDQPWGTFDAMPWLSGELERSDSGWSSFPNAFANTPLCCPVRAALLTGRHARHTGVLRNEDGAKLDETSTLATWLHEAGYRTGLVGKYLNRFPFGRLPYVPRGWDRFVAKRNQSGTTVYRDFRVVEQGSQVRIRDAYATDWLAGRAIDFVRTTPPGRPLFLLFAPSAPHEPWIPADRDEGAYADEPVTEPPNVVGALRGAPPWVRALPVPGAAQRAAWVQARRRSDETLLAVDEAIRGIVGALGDRLDRTFIFVLSDHGYSFGEHRWEGKKCPYDACVRIPLAVYAPGPPVAGEDRPVSTVDLAPTFLELAGIPPPGSMDGRSFAAAIEGEPGGPSSEGNSGAVYLEWAGDDEIPAWTAVRTRGLKLIRYADGFDELYDLQGRLAPPDRWETRNLARDLRYAGVLEHLRGLLSRNLGGPV